MTKTRSRELDFGPLEKPVRWLEETPATDFPGELDRRLAKLRPESLDEYLRAAACAATRSVRMEGAGRVPHGLLLPASARALVNGLPWERQRAILRPVLLQVNQEIHDPGFGPYRLLSFEEVAGQGKEGTLFSFLEAVRAGETDWADHRFAWLVRNLEKDQIVDLLLSAGLEGVTGGAHKIIGVVEVASLLQGLGWEWAPVWLRPVVRHQAGHVSGLDEYDRCRDLVARHDLLRMARRRPPGQPSWGERDPHRFFQEAVRWAEAEPEQRSSLLARLLTEGIGLEDVGDALALAATLLFLQETLRHRQGKQTPAQADWGVHLLTSALSMRQLVRLGTPGQRVMGLLLAGWVPPLREVRLDARTPECAWWLPPVSHLLESAGEQEAALRSFPGEFPQMVRGGQANGLLPAMTAHLQSGGTAEGLLPVIAEAAPERPIMGGLAIKFERIVSEAYRSARTPHRWLLLWSAALAFALWPEKEETAPLQQNEGTGTLST